LSNAYVLANQGRYHEAIDMLKEIIDAENLSAKYDDAVREYKRAIYVDANLAIAFFNLGNIYLFQKKHAQAKREFQNAVKVLKNNPPHDTVLLSESLTNELLLLACRRSLDKINL
jgi:tetratricopeptide (TPR) repeat protein